MAEERDETRAWLRSGRLVVIAHQDALNKRKAANQRASRAKRKAKVELEPTPEFLAQLDAAIGPAMERPPLTRDQQLHEARLLATWLAQPGKRQEQYRAQERLYRAVRLLVLRQRRILGTGWGDDWEGWEPDIEPVEFAPLLAAVINEPVDRHRARRLLDQHAKLEGPGGPWPARVKR